MLHEEITSKVINAFYTVYNTLGYGFLEKVYENSLAYELSKSGIKVEQQAPIQVFYDGCLVGEYFADLIVEGRVILELKAADSITEQHKAQLLNYLKATKYEVGLLFNFGPEAKFARKILTNDRKKAVNVMQPHPINIKREIREDPSDP